jgi:hypothetical protein
MRRKTQAQLAKRDAPSPQAARFVLRKALRIALLHSLQPRFFAIEPPHFALKTRHR